MALPFKVMGLYEPDKSILPLVDVTALDMVKELTLLSIVISPEVVAG